MQGHNVNPRKLVKILHVIPRSATMDDIKKAYRSMALQYHHDVCHDPSMKEDSTERMFYDGLDLLLMKMDLWW